jgi:hypothetical protein
MLLPILDLGKRAIFTGPHGAVLLPRTNYYFSVDRGTVYFRFGKSQRHFGAFHVRRHHMGYIASIWGRLTKHVASYATAGISSDDICSESTVACDVMLCDVFIPLP